MGVDRRRLLLATGAAGLAAGLPRTAQAMPGRMMGADAALGHRLREGNFPDPSSETRTTVAIVGGGIAGLSAAWQLHASGLRDFTLLELEAAVGGNAASGRNAVSPFPWGAHYVPLLTRESVHARALFESLGIITGAAADGTPIYNDYYLCADPRERLWIQGRWQDDLLPQIGVSDADRRQYAAFGAAMTAFRAARGADGRKAFAIPIDASSADPAFRALDHLTMAGWMRDQGYDSAPLHWYVDYCTRDDFGTAAAEVSAYAGIHYFAARDGKGAEDDTQSVLTWPDGNGWIVGQMKQRLAAHLTTGALAWRVQPQDGGVAVDVYDPATDRSRRVLARAAILAVPHFVADRLLGRAPDPAHSYAPWAVANVTVSRMPEGRGAPLCWDNVFHDSRSLGYVVATHQSLARVQRSTVLTHYWPLADAPPDEARRLAAARTLPEWQALVLDDLLHVHPELEGAVQSVDVWVWGHGMIRPMPGYLWGPARAAACAHAPPVFFAHSDMSGISIFEEANYRGVLAADAALAMV